MRQDTVITGIVMLLFGIGIGYMIAMGQLVLKTRSAFHQVAAGMTPEQAEVKIRVLAKKYSWHFQYPGDDGVFGKTSLKAISEMNPMGLDFSDVAAADDIVANELVLPCQQTVGFIITSADVIHSLGHLEGDFEEDAVPGIDAQETLMTPQMPRAGRLKCVQLCGPGHVNCQAPYRFVTPAEYQDWLVEQGKIAKQAKAE